MPSKMSTVSLQIRLQHLICMYREKVVAAETVLNETFGNDKSFYTNTDISCSEMGN